MGSNIALGVVIGGAVGASFGRALSDSSAEIAAFKSKAEKLGAEQVRFGAALELRGLNLRRYAELRRETKAIEAQRKASFTKVTELGKRLADVRKASSQADGAGRFIPTGVGNAISPFKSLIVIPHLINGIIKNA